MDRENPPDLAVDDWLKHLGVGLLCEWDVLVFLYRHQASLVSAEHVSRLLGYPTGAVVAALECLGSSGLVERSRVDQGVRLYQFAAPEEPRRGDALHQLLTLAGGRAGRLLLSAKLRRGRPPNENKAQLQDEGRAKWLKAV